MGVPIQTNRSDLTPANFRFNWHPSHPLKRFVRPWLNLGRHRLHTLRYRKHLPITVKLYRPARVLSGVGIPLEEARGAVRQLLGEPVKRLLVIGCGDGLAMGEWLSLQPTETVGVDLFNFGTAWQQVQEACGCRGHQVSFLQADIADLSRTIPEGWADAIVSDAVFEHCQDLPAVVRELARLLRPGGMLYASYGPIWHAAGGDHFSGRGGLEHSYNHLTLSQDDYRRYFKDHCQENEPVQDGGRYVPLGLFSKLGSAEYFKLYADNSLTLEHLVVEVSAQGLAFRATYPSKWQELCEKHLDYSEEEFLIKGHWVWLRRGPIL